LRYAAAATIGGQVIIVGGSHGETAEDEILRFDPISRSVTRIGRLPRPLTHASAVTFGSYVYVLGGRGSSPESQTSAIFAIDPLDGFVTPAGRLPLALSDAAASVARGQILIAGGHSSSGTQFSIFALEPHPGVSIG
jgi:N-acetylneuraminic acid mutarotase